MATTASKPFAIVTGASSGIGFELARIAAENGHDLLIAADRDLDPAAARLRALGASVEAVEADLATPEGVDRLLSAAAGRTVDALFANAGHGLGQGFLDQDFDDIRHVVDTNVTGTLYLLQKVARGMRDRNAGRILITGSIAGYLPGSFQAVYNGTKAFIDSFAWALRNELKETNVSVTLLMPGATETEFFERAGMEDTMVGTMKKDDPAKVAQTGYDAMMQGKTDVVYGLKNKLQTAAANVLPANVTAEMHRKQAEPGYHERKGARRSSDGTGLSDGSGFAAKALLGLAAGAVGVWALDRADWFMWKREGLESRWNTIRVRPKHLPPAETLVTTLEERSGRDLSPGGRAAASQAVHYSLGIAPAIGYALLRDKLPGDGVARGALYGLGMFVAQDEVLNSVTGLGAKPQDYPWQAHARGLVAHTIYGVATELALNLFEELAAKQQRGGAYAIH